MKYSEREYWSIIIDVTKNHKSLKQISLETGIPYYTVRSIYRRYVKFNSPIPHVHNSGWSFRKINNKVIQQVRRIQIQNKSFSLKSIQDKLKRRNINISKTSVYNIRKLLKFKKRKIKLIPELKYNNLVKRREWCRERQNHNWKDMIFTDECCFELNYNNRFCYYINKRELNNINNIRFAKNEKFMIGTAISYKVKFPITVWKVTNKNSSLDTRVDSETYRNYLMSLEDNVKSFYPEADSIDLILDNARPHYGRATYFFDYEAEVLRPVYLPPYSPDLNPIEMVWSLLKRAVYTSQYNSMDELVRITKREWKKINLNIIRNCIAHSKRRCREVYNADGGWPN